MDPGHVRVRPDPFVIHIRVASKIFEDFYDFGIALPLKERFFLLKPNILCMSMLRSMLICYDYRSCIDIHKSFGFNAPSEKRFLN